MSPKLWVPTTSWSPSLAPIPWGSITRSGAVALCHRWVAQSAILDVPFGQMVSVRSSKAMVSCTARIFDWVVDLHCRQQAGDSDGWLVLQGLILTSVQYRK